MRLFVLLIAALAGAHCGGTNPAAAATPLGPPFDTAPFIAELGSTYAAIHVWTGADVAVALEYRPLSGFAATRAVSPPGRIHHFRLEGLMPETAYAYVVQAQTRVPRTAPPAVFATRAREPETITFAVYGDNRGQPARHGQVIRGMLARAPEFALHTGDAVKTGTERAEWLSFFFTPAAGLLASMPIYFAVGNHEAFSPWLTAAFGLPPRRTWRMRSEGPVDFFLLDSNAPYGPVSAQTKWLAGALAASRAPHKVAVFHHPLHSTGPHGGLPGLQRAWAPLFERYGVRAVFTGHDHIYLRSRPMVRGQPVDGPGVTYFVTGGGGAPLYEAQPAPWVARLALVHHFALASADAGMLTVRVFDIDGNVIDAVSFAPGEPIGMPPPRPGAPGPLVEDLPAAVGPAPPADAP